MTVKNLKAAASPSREISLTRIFDAPREMVWKAWTDDKQVETWWGPRGFTLTTQSKELKTGGHWHYIMHGPDGTDYPNKTKYLQVIPYEKLLYDHGGNDEREPLFRVTVQFSDMKGKKTRMDMTMTCATPEAAAETRKFIKKAGGESTWDRLAEYVEKVASGKDKFVINRSFDAPIALVFEMWTNPKYFPQWLPPKGATMEFIRADIIPGGSTFYAMEMPGGVKMYGRAEYLKIEKPRTLIYTQQFCDENEKLSRHPFAPTWPATMLTTVQFFEEGPQRTRVAICWESYGDATREEIETFLQSRSGMTQGWTGSLDKLEELLAG